MPECPTSLPSPHPADLERLFQLSPDLMCIVTPAGYFSWVNGAWEAATGYTREQLCTRPLVEFVHREDIDHVFCEVASRLQNRQPLHLTHRFVRQDGTFLWLEWRAVPAADGTLFATARDISDRIAAEQRVRDNEKLFHALFNQAGDVVLALDYGPDGIPLITAANDAACTLYGYTRDELLGQPLTRLAHSLTPELLQSHRRALELAGTVTFTSAHVCKDGHLTDLEITIRRVQLENRAMLLCVGRNITEARLREAAICASEARFRALAESASDTILTVDQDHRIVYYNPAALSTFGFTDAELLLCPVGFLLPGGLPQAGSTRHLQTRARRRNGTEFPVEVSLAQWSNAEGTFLTAILRDVTERKAAEDALRDSEERFRSLFNCGSDAMAVWQTAPDGRPGAFIEANAIACRQLGYTHAELLQLSPLEVWAPAERNTATDTIAALRDRRQALAEATFVTRQGDRLPVEISARSFQFRGRDAMVAVWRDIAPRRLLEEQLRQAQKMEAIGRLAGGVAHDFNNILTSTLLNLDMLQEDRSLPKGVHTAIEELTNDAKRAMRLTQQLLLFSRRQVVRMTTLELNDAVAHLLKMLGRILGEDITLTFSRSGIPSWVEADEGMIEQVIMNLCVNARDALPRGGEVTLQVQPRHFPYPPGTHPDARAGDFVRLSVIDRGSGMDAETLRHLFEPFFTTKPVGRGTGLGLATVYGIVKRHHGWIEVESAVGQGSSFHIYLPAVPPPAAAPAPAQAAANPSGTETILLVEDEPGVRHLAAFSLTRLGYKVIEAASGREALAIWREQHSRVDLVISDMVMPEGVTGLDLAHQFLAERPNLRFVLSSGYHPNLLRGGLPTHRHIRYLPKPYELKTLAHTVRHCLDGACNGEN